jgi:cobalt/nickel transport system permease protein
VAAISRIDTLAHSHAWTGLHIADRAMLAGGLLLAAIALPPVPGAVLVLLAATAAAVLGAKVSLREYWGIVRIPMGFVLTGALSSAVTLRLRGGLALGFGHLDRAAPLALRGLAGAGALGLFALLIPIPELLARLRRIGVPAVVCEVAMLMYRLIAVTLGEARVARQTQEHRFGYDGFGNSMRSSSLLIASTASRTMQRAERLTIGLAARGFEGDLPMLTSASSRSRRFELAAGALLVLITVASLAWSVIR